MGKTNNLKIYPGMIKIGVINRIVDVKNKYQSGLYPLNIVKYKGDYLSLGCPIKLKKEKIMVDNERISYPKMVGFRELESNRYHRKIEDLKYFYIGMQFYEYIAIDCFLEEKYQHQQMDINFVIYIGNYIMNKLKTREQFVRHVKLYQSESLYSINDNIYLEEKDLNTLYDQYTNENVQPKIRILKNEKENNYYFV